MMHGLISRIHFWLNGVDVIMIMTFGALIYKFVFIYGYQYLHQRGKPCDRTNPSTRMLLHHRLATLCKISYPLQLGVGAWISG